MKTVISTFGWLCIFCITSLQAQQALSLDEAITSGLENVYQIAIDQKQLDIAENNDSWGQAGKLPVVNLQVLQNNNLSNNKSPNPFALNGAILNNNVNANLDAQLTLFNGSRVNISKRQLEANVKNRNALSKVTIESTIRSIMEQYYATALQQSQVKVLAEVLALSRDRVARQRIRNQLGQGSSFDILQAEDAYLADSSSFLIQQNLLETQYRNLNLAMGAPIQQRYQVSDTLTKVTLVENFDALLETLLSNNANLQALEIQKELSQINTNLQKTTLSPRVLVNTGVNGSLSFLTPVSQAIQDVVGRGAQSGNNITPYINFSAIYNLYDGHVNKTNIQNAKIQEEIADLQIKDTKRSLEINLQNLFYNFRNQERMLEVAEAQLFNARKNMTIATQRFQAAQLSSFDYRAVQLAYINANQNRLNALFNLKNTEIAILQLTGNLTK